MQDADELMADYNEQLRQNKELDAQRASEIACGRLLRRNFGVMEKVRAWRPYCSATCIALLCFILHGSRLS